MTAALMTFPGAGVAEFSRGDLVRLDDGRDGRVLYRNFAIDGAGAPIVAGYGVMLTSGRGNIEVEPDRVHAWGPASPIAAPMGAA